MNRNIVQITRHVIVWSCAIVLSVSCVREIDVFFSHRGAIVPMMKSVETKAQDGGQHEECVPEKMISSRVISSSGGFDLIETVYENNLNPFEDAGATKGKVETTGGIKMFNMDVYAEDEWHDNTLGSGVQGSLGMPNDAGLYFSASCSKTGSVWGMSKTGGKAREGTGDEAGALYWINGVPMSFWSYNVVQPAWTPSTSTAVFEYTVDSDVSKQKDPVFAYSREIRTYYDDGSNYGRIKEQSSTSGAEDDQVNIWFFHALSAVQFIQNSSLTASDYRISNIEIQNVKNSTTCTISADNSIVAALHTPNISFSHNVTGSGKVNFSQSYGAADASLTEPSDAATNGRFKPGDGKTFLMIPQTLGADAKLKVTFMNTTTAAQETTSPVFAIDTEWEAGKYYIYKLDLKGAVKVDISESCSSTAKSNVKFKNTSSLNEYIRAAVVANWYDASGNVVAAWDKSRDGNITLGSGWTTGSDGFYYHTDPVTTNNNTSNLFDSFVKPTAAPVTGAHFEMTILVQAVCSDGFTSCADAF